jgi:hypothetical protein
LRIGIGILWLTKLLRVAMFDSVVLRPPAGPGMNLRDFKSVFDILPNQETFSLLDGRLLMKEHKEML